MKKIYIAFSSLLFFCAIEAQNLSPTVVNSSGGFVKNANHSLEWSLGELAVSTVTNNSNMLTQGFIQPFTIMVGTSDKARDYKIAYFPNPIEDILYLITDHEDILSIQIHDLLGRLIQNSDFSQSINLQHLKTGIYNISLLDKNYQIITSFKINKI
ncbi:MAG: T9SS type A sorting domain-containing protein [Saprospiraceae bacterium]|nr:T9SS type A sorting domain-containing protein [Saprospiraceae bacterium]